MSRRGCPAFQPKAEGARKSIPCQPTSGSQPLAAMRPLVRLLGTVCLNLYKGSKTQAPVCSENVDVADLEWEDVRLP